MAKKLISIDDSAAAGSRLPSAVRTEIGAVPAVAAKLTTPSGGTDGQVLQKSGSTVVWATGAVGGGAATTDKGESVMSRIRLKTGDIKTGIAGDSTGNAPNEWADLHTGYLAAKDTVRRCEILHWNDTAQAYDAATVVQPGTSGPTAATVFSDTFTRTAAELDGTTPDVGTAWGKDAGNAVGDWSIDGTAALRTADTTNGLMLANAGTDADFKVTYNMTAGAATGAGQNDMRFPFRYLNSSNYLWAFVTITNAGSAVFYLRKVIGGVTTTYGPSSFTIDTGSANVPLTIVCETIGTTFRATVNGVTITDTLTSGDVAALVGANKGGFGYGRQGNRVLDFKIETTSTAAARLLRFYNASMSGSTLTYHQSRLAAMFPEALDLLFISSSHNYSTDTAVAYLAKLDTFIAAFRAVQPDAVIVISSQNLRRSPADNIAAHTSRLAALKSYAVKRGYGYLPVAEAWAASAADPATLVLADGIHPSVGAGSGSELWAATANTYMDAR